MAPSGISARIRRGVSLPEELYRADFELLDRYQAFSSELLRIALLGIAGHGFLLTKAIWKPQPGTASGAVRVLVLAGLVAFGLTAALALGHRYYSSDSLTHLIGRLRLAQIANAGGLSKKESTEVAGRIDDESQGLKFDFARSSQLLLWATLMLGLGTALVTISFGLLLFVTP